MPVHAWPASTGATITWDRGAGSLLPFAQLLLTGFRPLTPTTYGQRTEIARNPLQKSVLVLSSCAIVGGWDSLGLATMRGLALHLVVLSCFCALLLADFYPLVRVWVVCAVNRPLTGASGDKSARDIGFGPPAWCSIQLVGCSWLLVAGCWLLAVCCLPIATTGSHRYTSAIQTAKAAS